MSSGACRALVAIVLTLAATVVMTMPVGANTEALNETSNVTYEVDPSTGEISVRTVITFKTRGQQRFQPDSWGPIIVEQRARPKVSRGFSVAPGFSEAAGPWKQIEVQVPAIEGGAEKRLMQLSYDLDASITQRDQILADTPARVDNSYIYLCVPGQDTDTGTVQIKIADAPSKWKPTQNGTTLDRTSNGFTLRNSKNPARIFTCIEATRDGRLSKDTFIGPAGRQVELQQWASETGWLQAAKATTKPALDAIHAFLAHDMPGEGPVIIRESPERSIGGYASAHDTPDIVQLDERGGTIDPEHELAHAWFGTDNFVELWLREGMAEWTATAIRGQVCSPATSNDIDLDLADWQVVQPTSPIGVEQLIAGQEAAACGIVSAVAERMPDEQWREVIGSLLGGETKYISSQGPQTGSLTTVDYREWLDAVDERGLAPAAKADPGYAGDIESLQLDFAQDLLDEFGVPASGPELVKRSEARAYYHQFLNDSLLDAPLAVRKNLDDWRFDEAIAALDKSYEVLNTLNEADALVPTAGLFPLIAGPFRDAASIREIDAVLEEALVLLESAEELVDPLGALRVATPEGWDLPAAIRNAINERRFDDAMSTIPAAIKVVREVSTASDALPNAGLLDKYRGRYESTSSNNGLSELAEEASADRTRALAAGRELKALQDDVGEWQIPSAVTAPIEQGQIADAREVIGDARAVVASVKAADLALESAGVGEDIRPRFETAENAVDMEALKTEAARRQAEAESVGNALTSLRTRVPGWTIPAAVTVPVEARQFAAAAATASAAQRWIENAWQADQDLDQIMALDRIREDFERATTLAQLETGAELAESWAQAASHVRRADDDVNAPRDLLSDFGLWGVDVDGPLQEALDAAIAGEVGTAINKSAEVSSMITNAGSSGSLRMAGLVFFAIAVLGVLGLWVMLRRQSGPSWARSSTPHWLQDGRKKDGDKKDGG